MTSKLFSISILLFMIASMGAVGNAQEGAVDENSQIQVLLYRFQNAADSTEQRDIAIQLSRTRPKTLNDGVAVRDALRKQPFDLLRYEIASHLVSQLKNTIYESVLIDILKDEKAYWAKADVNKLSAARDVEYLLRHKTIMFAAGLLGALQCRNAAPILKEYLQFKGPDYYASQALAQIGDSSAGDMLPGK